MLLEVERFSKRTISVCLSQQEEESDLPTLAEVSSYEAIGSDDGDEDVAMQSPDQYCEGCGDITPELHEGFKFALKFDNQPLCSEGLPDVRATKKLEYRQHLRPHKSTCLFEILPGQQIK